MSKITLPGSRRVGHLTLFRDSHQITPREFNALSAEERLEMVRCTPGRAKYDLLIEAVDAAELVKRLAPQEVYALVREIGVEDMADLVEMTSGEQLTTFVDLDAWRGGEYDGRAALHWLRLLAESGEERLWEVLSTLDGVMLALFFAQFITVSGGLGDLLEEDRLHQGELDRIYQVEYKDSELAKLIGGYLDLIYRRDRDAYLELMEMIRCEQGAELEEIGLQQRNGRLLDQGIPDFEGAATVYAWLDPVAFEEQSPTGKVPLRDHVLTPIPGSLVSAVRPGGLLAELLAGEVSEEFVWELTCLTNKVLVASRADIGDAEQLAAGVQETYANLEVALGYLCGNDLGLAEQAVSGHYLEHLFRLGYSLQLGLQRRARALYNEIGSLLDPPYLRLLEGLLARRPLFTPETMDAGRGVQRPFHNVTEVEMATRALADIDAQLQLFAAFPFGTDVVGSLDLEGCTLEGDELTLSTLFLTAWANRLLGRDFYPAPLGTAELPALQSRLGREGKLHVELRSETLNWLETLATGSESFGEYCLELVEEGVCGVAPEHLDARFVAGLLVRG